MSKQLLIFLVLITTSGCASIRAREEQDPGHGGANEVMRKIGLVAQLVCAPPTLALRFVSSLTSSKESQ